MYDIFNRHEECIGSSQPRTVLIEGTPGTGKTTYCHKIAYDWATNKMEEESSSGTGFPDFQVALLLKCRDIECNLWDDIEDKHLPRAVKEKEKEFFKSFLWDIVDEQLLTEDITKEDKEEFFKFVRQNQSGVLLLIDGLDEVPTKILPAFKKVIQGKIFSECHMIATARQEVGIEVRKCFDTLLEIEGWSEEDTPQFVNKYFQKKSELAEMLLEALRNNGELRDLASNPLNSTLLCLIWEELEGFVPEGRGQLYLKMVESVLRRYRTKQGLSKTDQNLMDVYKPDFKRLGSIAMNCLIQGNMSFEDKEVSIGNFVKESPAFEFLSVQPGSKRTSSRRYSFLHKSFQEFFAGFYLYGQLVDNEVTPEKITDDTRYFREMKTVFFFTCGILAVQCEEQAVALFECIATKVNEGGQPNNDLLEALECLKECKVEHDKPHQTIFGAVGSSLKLENVDLRSLLLDDADAVALVLGEIIKNNSTIRKLNLSSNCIGDEGCGALAEGIQINDTLTELNLHCNEVGDAGCAKLAQSFNSNSALTNLNLSANRIGDDGVAALAKALETNPTLSVLDLSQNDIGNDGLIKLARSIASNLALTSLHLSANSISDSGVAALAEAIKTNSTIAELDLSENRIGDNGCVALAKRMVSSTLNILNLSSNKIGNGSSTALADLIRKHLMLKNLNLSRNKIDDVGADTLAKAVEEEVETNSSLEVLNLSYNNISSLKAAQLNCIEKICIDYDDRRSTEDEEDEDEEEEEEGEEGEDEEEEEEEEGEDEEEEEEEEGEEGEEEEGEEGEDEEEEEEEGEDEEEEEEEGEEGEDEEEEEEEEEEGEEGEEEEGEEGEDEEEEEEEGEDEEEEEEEGEEGEDEEEEEEEEQEEEEGEEGEEGEGEEEEEDNDDDDDDDDDEEEEDDYDYADSFINDENDDDVDDVSEDDEDGSSGNGHDLGYDSDNEDGGVNDRNGDD